MKTVGTHVYRGMHWCKSTLYDLLLLHNVAQTHLTFLNTDLKVVLGAEFIDYGITQTLFVGNAWKTSIKMRIFIQHLKDMQEGQHN